MKAKIGLLIVPLTFVLAITVFVFLLFTAATDPKGAVALIIYTPIVFGLPFLTYYFAKTMLIDGKLQSIMRKLSGGFLAFLILFYVCAPIPYLNAFPKAMVKVVAIGYEALSGESPVEWEKRQRESLK